MLDEDQQTLIKLDGKRLKSYAEKFVPPVRMAKQYLANCFLNLRLFAKNDFQMKSGMKFLMESFYQSIVSGVPLPIPYGEIVMVSHIMDAVIADIDMNKRTLASGRQSRSAASGANMQQQTPLRL
jgi:hypothetical protein